MILHERHLGRFFFPKPGWLIRFYRRTANFIYQKSTDSQSIVANLFCRKTHALTSAQEYIGPVSSQKTQNAEAGYQYNACMTPQG